MAHFPYYHPEKGFAEAPSVIGIDDFKTSQTRPHSAIRVGSHKLLHFYEDKRHELYDLASDPSEEHDLSQTNPQRTRQLARQLSSYLSHVDARLPQATR